MGGISRFDTLCAATDDGEVNPRQRLWWRTALFVAAVWAVAAAVTVTAGRRRMTAGRVEAWAAANRLEPDQAPAGRMAVVEGLADRVNRLSFEERRAFRQDGAARDLFLAMTPEERARYIDLTLSTGMRQVMEAFNRMAPEERRRMVDRALQDLDRAERDGGLARERDPLDEATRSRIVEEGFRQYFAEASAETKLDLEPLILRLQTMVQGRR